MTMRTGIILCVLPGLFLLVSCSQEPGANPANPDSEAVFSGGGYNQFGFNLKAQRFRGIADGADWNFDGTYYGDTYHAGDDLSMKWNDEWERGLQEGWASPPYDARCSYMWRGNREEVVHSTWKYDIIWVGADLQASDRWQAGGFPIWDEFEVMFSGRTVATVDFWDAQALPPGMVCPTVE